MNKAAETVDTYTFNPEPRSTFSPQNIAGERDGKVTHASQSVKSTSQPMKLEQVNTRAK